MYVEPQVHSACLVWTCFLAFLILVPRARRFFVFLVGYKLSRVALGTRMGVSVIVSRVNLDVTMPASCTVALMSYLVNMSSDVM